MLRTLQAAFLRPAIAAWLRSEGAAWRSYPQPVDEPRVEVAGPDRLRVLVAGGGLAASYGVATHNLGLGGHLARKLAAATGRGVRVDINARTKMTVSALTQVLVGITISDYDAVVITIGGNEAFALMGTGTWKHSMGELLAAIEPNDAAGSPPVFVIGIPPISSIVEVPSWAEAALDDRVLHLNECTAQLASLSPTRTFIPLTPTGVRTTSMSDEKPYSHWAAEISNGMVSVLNA